MAIHCENVIIRTLNPYQRSANAGTVTEEGNRKHNQKGGAGSQHKDEKKNSKQQQYLSICLYQKS